MPLSRLIYVSESNFDPDKGTDLSQLNAILSASNRNNKLADITGALVFDGHWFIQVLEGKRDVLLKTFERLKDDDRHTNIALVELTAIDARVFGNWWMGLAIRNDATQSAFAPYLRQGQLYPEEISGQQFLQMAQTAAKFGYNRQIVEPASRGA
jgi:phage protein U